MAKRASHWKRKRAFWVRERERVIDRWLAQTVRLSYELSWDVISRVSQQGAILTRLDCEHVCRQVTDECFRSISYHVPAATVKRVAADLLQRMDAGAPSIDADESPMAVWEQGVRDMLAEAHRRRQASQSTEEPVPHGA